jgi:hypothetical protein
VRSAEVSRGGTTRRLGTQPEDHVCWTQYSVMPRPQLFLKLDQRWLDAAGWHAFDELNGYELSAPEALPAGGQASGDAWFSVSNVPREWEEHRRLQDLAAGLLANLGRVRGQQGSSSPQTGSESHLA